MPPSISSVLPPLAAARSRRTFARPSAWPGWAREPLLHFAVLGAIIFGVDHCLIGREDDPHTIVVGKEVDGEAERVFRQARGREPDTDELYALRRVWLDNEVLYREGLALGVDKGDSAIRERVIFKALSVVDASTKLPKIDEKQLREWFEAHRVRYDEPARYDFQEAVLAGEGSESAVRGFVRALNGGTPGDAQAGLRVFKGRPHANLVQAYGEDFARALESLPRAEWHALQTREGWRAVRLEAVTPPKPAAFEPLRGVVLQDWTDATLSEQRSQAVKTLTRKYTIKVAEARS